MFSIGLPLVAAGVLATVALIGTLTSGSARGTSAKIAAPMAAGGAVVAVTIVVAGFVVAEFAIRCPATGIMSGGGPSLLGGNYSYSCDSGRLTITRQ